MKLGGDEKGEPEEGPPSLRSRLDAYTSLVLTDVLTAVFTFGFTAVRVAGLIDTDLSGFAIIAFFTELRWVMSDFL